MDLLVIAVGVVPTLIGLVLRRWEALVLVLALWVLLVLVVAIGWGLDYDEVSGADFVLLLALTVLLPAEAVASLAVLVGRLLFGPARQGRESG